MSSLKELVPVRNLGAPLSTIVRPGPRPLEKELLWLEESYRADTKAESFRGLIVPIMDVLRRNAIRMAGDEATGEDLLHDALLRAWTHFDKFEAGTNFKAWMFRILTNLFINSYRRSVRRPTVSLEAAEAGNAKELAIDLASSPSEDGLDGASDTMKRAVARLPHGYRDVLVLVAIGDMSYAEVAERLGIPIGTVMSRLFRARELMKAELSEWYESGAWMN
jgi:RNA polymerase sigma-70 factor (ECF subfamily)